MSNYQNRNNNNNSGGGNNYNNNHSSGTVLYDTPWLKTPHSWTKRKEDPTLDPETTCNLCGITVRECLEAIPCETRELQEAKSKIAQLEAQLAAATAAASGGGVQPYNSAGAAGSSKTATVRSRESAL